MNLQGSVQEAEFCSIQLRRGDEKVLVCYILLPNPGAASALAQFIVVLWLLKISVAAKGPSTDGITGVQQHSSHNPNTKTRVVVQSHIVGSSRPGDSLALA